MAARFCTCGILFVAGVLLCVFFFNDTATTEIYTLSLHDALPIFDRGGMWSDGTNLQLKARGSEVVEERFAPVEPHTYAVEVVDFIDRLRDGRRPLNTEVEGISVLKVI